MTFPLKITENSLSVAIVVIVIFWFTCKCVKRSEYFNANSIVTETPKDVGLYYGSSPMVLGSPYGLNYIRVNEENEIEIPNSKTALRRLMDEGSYKCRTLETDHDNLPSSHLLKKNSLSNTNNLKGAQSQARARNNVIQS